MLKKGHIAEAIDLGATKLTKDFHNSAARIAHSSSMVKISIREQIFDQKPNGQLESCGEIFDVCEVIDANLHLLGTEDEKLLEKLKSVRASAAITLIRDFYTDEIQKNPSNRSRLAWKKKIALLIARELPILRDQLPQYAFGPEWLQSKASLPLVDALREYAYDLDSDSEDWSKIREFLPSSLAKMYDHTLLPMELPERIESEEHAKALLEEIARRESMTVQELADPSLLGELMIRFPAYKMVIDYFAKKRAKSKSKLKNSDSQDGQSTS